MIPGAGRAVGAVDSLPVGRGMKQEAPPERRGVVHLLSGQNLIAQMR